MQKGGSVYFLTNIGNTVLYIGVTANLPKRIFQHISKEFSNSFTAKYNCIKLIYYENFHSIEEAIAREKNLKNWKRAWKDELINKHNPDWKDLSPELEKW